MFKEYEQYDALGLAELIQSKQLSALEVLEAAVAKAEAENPRINAINYPMYERARAYLLAEPAPTGIFAGVPFLLKDLSLMLKDEPLTNACRYFQHFVPDHDATLVQRYKAAGLTFMGKTNTPELGLSITTESELLGPCLNPIDTAYSTGGSSGGAAAAVAAGIVPMANASDGGGSIRIPASCCGVFGLKPTRARTPCGPDIGEGWAGMSISHAITRSVRDSAALFDATQGYEVGAPYSVPPLQRSALEAIQSPVAALKIAVMPNAPGEFVVHQECLAAVQHAAGMCEALGHHVEYAEPKIHFQALVDAIYTVVCCNMANLFAACAKLHGRAVTEQQVEPATWAMLQYAKRYTGADYASAIFVLHGETRRLAYFFQQYDMLLTPTLARAPVRIGELAYQPSAHTDIKTFHYEVFCRYSPFTAIFNASGQPAMSVPLYRNQQGLPIGVQFAAAYADDLRLFQLAQQLLN